MNFSDVPPELLQAHEDGQVVFFCGAGISTAAKLPMFKQLTEQVYADLNCSWCDNEPEKTAYNNAEFDRVFELLEQRYPASDNDVRKAVAKNLTPNLEFLAANKKALNTHKALLKLSKNKNNEIRLVTTNFDRLFEKAAIKIECDTNVSIAPTVPVPRPHRWNSLVYLHGALPENTQDNFSLNQLVLSSGDFGRAYLTERWAARFISELCRNYIVCFVGYSLGDPVLRYLMDALGADRRLNNTLPKVYAFAPYESNTNNKEEIEAEWKVKQVEPLIYSDSNEHQALHDVLSEWAKRFVSGVNSKKHIIAQAAQEASPKANDILAKDVLWALRGETKSTELVSYFANISPPMPLRWLHIISNGEVSYFTTNHLVGFQEPIAEWCDKSLRLASWLLRFLNEPELLVWFANSGGFLHIRFKEMLARYLNELSALQQSTNDDDKRKLEEIKERSPLAIPSHRMLVLWHLLLVNKVSAKFGYELMDYSLSKRVKQNSLLFVDRFLARDVLSPFLSVEHEHSFIKNKFDTTEPANHLRLELFYKSDSFLWLANDDNLADYQKALAQLLDGLEQSLKDSLDILKEVGLISADSDLSSIKLPSISEHEQSRFDDEMAKVLRLLREAWLGLVETDPELAIQKARGWFEQEHLLFKRLALFAATKVRVEAGCWMNWLTVGSEPLLWLTDAQREILRLLAEQGGELTKDDQLRLEEVIVKGPPKSLYKENIAKDEWLRIKNRSIWLRLVKLKSSVTLGEEAAATLLDLEQRHPGWIISENQREEFPYWRSTGFIEAEKVEAPAEAYDLARWLITDYEQSDPLMNSNWDEICRNEPELALSALTINSESACWPQRAWEKFLYAGQTNQSSFATELLNGMQIESFKKLAHPISWWLMENADFHGLNESLFLDLCRKITTHYEADIGPLSILSTDIMHDAANHPVGLVAEAILVRLNGISARGKLPQNIADYLQKLLNKESSYHLYARVVLSAELLFLYQFDDDWVEENLLPSFSWADNEDEALAVWSAFLRKIRRVPSLLQKLKSDFLAVARNYDKLQMIEAENYVYFLTFCSLEGLEGFSSEDFKQAFLRLPKQALAISARVMREALEAAGDKYPAYWENYIEPFWHSVWPKDRALISEELSQQLVSLCIASKSKIPSAVELFKGWVIPIKRFYSVIYALAETSLCETNPEAVLELLSKIIDERVRMDELDECLKRIVLSKPSLERDDRYLKLEAFI